MRAAILPIASAKGTKQCGQSKRSISIVAILHAYPAAKITAAAVIHFASTPTKARLISSNLI